MKATGIVRRVDELGRLVIPKEIRRTMRLAEGTPLEIFTDREGQIILKKYSPMMELGSFAKQYAESVAQTMNQKVAVSDRDQIIAVAGGGKRELLGKTISRQLEEMIINRENSIQAGLDKKTIPLISSAQAIYPICCEGDCIGAVILYSRENQTHFSETEYKAAACAASFLGKQMEG